jgi:CRISPR-associated Csx14 family protein
MASSNLVRTKVFISYSDEDQKFLDEFEKHLKSTMYNQPIDYWCRSKVQAGGNVVQEINHAIQFTKIAVLLASPNYMTSDFIYNSEFQQLLSAEKSQGIIILPVRLGHYNYEDTPLAKRRFLPTSKVLGAMKETERHEIWVSLVETIRQMLSTPTPLSLAPSYSSQSEQQELSYLPETTSYPPYRANTQPSNQQQPLPTQIKIKSQIGENILIASLGESPAVISVTYDWLTKKKDISIDRVIVLRSNDDEVLRAYKQVHKALSEKCDIRPEPLRFVDANSWAHTCNFLVDLYQLLENMQRQGNRVYLSLSGGRKSMAALMAWIVPFFSCIQGLYHVIDQNAQHLLSARDIEFSYRGQFTQIMHPDLNSREIYLIEIPFERGRQIDKKMIEDMYLKSNKDLEKMQYRELEETIQMRAIIEGRDLLNVFVTEQVYKKIEELCRDDKQRAIEVKTCLYKMSDPLQLKEGTLHDKGHNTSLQIFEDNNNKTQGFVYTIPSEGDEGRRIVVCQLEDKVNNEYRPLKRIKTSPSFSTTPRYQISDLPAVPYTESANSILIVPLGTMPMIATQLYTLLKYHENRRIREIFLVYPDKQGVKNAAMMVKEALESPLYNIPYSDRLIKGLKDILSEDDCTQYQQALEDVIDEALQAAQKYPNCKIDLALSGGRKGMTAMTIFAAQNKHIDHAYHTLITDEDLSESIERYEGTVEALKKLSPDKRSERLFLEEYKKKGLFTKFVLFRVPVFPAGKND